MRRIRFSGWLERNTLNKRRSPEGENTPVDSKVCPKKCLGALFVTLVISAALLHSLNVTEECRHQSGQYVDSFEAALMEQVIAKQVSAVQTTVISSKSETLEKSVAKQVPEIRQRHAEIQSGRVKALSANNEEGCGWLSGNYMDRNSGRYPIYRALLGFLTLALLMSVSGLAAWLLTWLKILNGNPCEYLRKLLEYKPEGKKVDHIGQAGAVPSSFARFITAIGAAGVLVVASATAFYPAFCTQPSLSPLNTAELVLQFTNLNQSVSQLARTAGTIENDARHFAYLQSMATAMQGIEKGVSGVANYTSGVYQNTRQLARIAGAIENDAKLFAYFQPMASAMEGIEKGVSSVANYTSGVYQNTRQMAQTSVIIKNSTDNFGNLLLPLQTIATATKVIGDGVNGVAAHTGEINKSLNGLNKLQTIATATQNIEKGVKDVAEHASEINKNLNGLDKHFIPLQTIATATQGIGKGVEGVATNTGKIDQSLNGLNGIGGSFKNIREIMTLVATSSSNVLAATSAVNTQISSTAGQVQQTSGHVERAVNQVHATGEQVAAMNRILAPIVFRTEDLSAKQVVTRPPYKEKLPVSMKEMDAICDKALKFDDLGTKGEIPRMLAELKALLPSAEWDTQYQVVNYLLQTCKLFKTVPGLASAIAAEKN